MSKPLTPTQRIAWDAIGHDQTKWTAVKKAMKAVGPHHRDTVARNIASILDDYEMTDAAELVRNLPAMEAAMAPAADALHRLVEAFPDAVEVAPVRPPRSTETLERVAPDDPPTPQAVEAATEWLLDDHAERVETGIVRPASERAGHLISIVRPLIYREAATRLRACADGMEVVPAGITLEAADRLDLDADEPEHIRDAGHVATRHGWTTGTTDLCPSRVCQATVDREEPTT